MGFEKKATQVQHDDFELAYAEADRVPLELEKSSFGIGSTLGNVGHRLCLPNDWELGAEQGIGHIVRFSHGDQQLTHVIVDGELSLEVDLYTRHLNNNSYSYMESDAVYV